MAKFVIEIVHPLWFLREYKTLDMPVVRIGRGFDNDLILGDPHICAEHLIVRTSSDPPGWVAQDISGQNGMYVRKLAKVTDRALIQSGDEIVIGRTRLRFFSPLHPVVPTKLLVPANRFLRTISRPVNVCSIMLVCIMSFVWHVYMTSLETISILKLASGTLVFLFLGVLWAGGWAFVGRMLKHKAQFSVLLGLGVIFLAIAVPFINVSAYLGYVTNSLIVEMVTAGVLLGGACAVFLIANLTLTTNIAFKKQLAVSLAIPLVIIAVLTLLYFSFKDEFNPNPVYYAALKPPFIKILPSQSIDQFLVETAAVFVFAPHKDLSK